MSRSNPAKDLNGAQPGHICDRCNKRVRTGDLVRAYATHYEKEGWILRRVWCKECGDTSISSETKDAKEVLIGAIFWNHRLISVEMNDRSRPYVESKQ